MTCRLFPTFLVVFLYPCVDDGLRVVPEREHLNANAEADRVTHNSHTTLRPAGPGGLTVKKGVSDLPLTSRTDHAGQAANVTN